MLISRASHGRNLNLCTDMYRIVQETPGPLQPLFRPDAGGLSPGMNARLHHCQRSSPSRTSIYGNLLNPSFVPRLYFIG